MSGTADLAATARVVVSLVVVLAVVAIAARVARRARGRGSGAGLRVVDRTGLSRDASLALVEVAGRSLVLGVTAAGVSVLTVLDNDPDPEPQPAQQPEQPEQRPKAPASAPAGWPAVLPAGRVGPRRARRGSHVAAVPDLDVLLGVEPAEFPELDVRPSTVRIPEHPDLELLPSTLRVDEFPDLASALRAAGRVTEPAADSVPRPRSAPAQAAPAPTTRREALRVSTPPPRTRPADRQASGAVLDPATWRQAIETLRDMTARRS